MSTLKLPSAFRTFKHLQMSHVFIAICYCNLESCFFSNHSNLSKKKGYYLQFYILLLHVLWYRPISFHRFHHFHICSKPLSPNSTVIVFQLWALLHLPHLCWGKLEFVWHRPSQEQFGRTLDKRLWRCGVNLVRHWLCSHFLGAEIYGSTGWTFFGEYLLYTTYIYFIEYHSPSTAACQPLVVWYFLVLFKATLWHWDVKCACVKNGGLR